MDNIQGNVALYRMSHLSTQSCYDHPSLLRPSGAPNDGRAALTDPAMLTTLMMRYNAERRKRKIKKLSLRPQKRVIIRIISNGRTFLLAPAVLSRLF